jgi:hypothetical protein
MSFNFSIDEEPAISDPLGFMLESLQEDSGTSKAAAHSPSSDSLPAEVPSETDEDADDISFSPRRQPTSTAGQYPSPQESQTNATYESEFSQMPVSRHSITRAFLQILQLV